MVAQVDQLSGAPGLQLMQHVVMLSDAAHAPGRATARGSRSPPWLLVGFCLGALGLGASLAAGVLKPASFRAAGTAAFLTGAAEPSSWNTCQGARAAGSTTPSVIAHCQPVRQIGIGEKGMLITAVIIIA